MMKAIVWKVSLCLAALLLLVLCGADLAEAKKLKLKSAITQHGKKAEVTRVFAVSGNWRNSWHKMEKGKAYRITAEGKWKIGPLCGFTGPDGKTPDGRETSQFCLGIGARIIRDANHATLIARVGEKGKPFAIGKQHEFTARKDGDLYLRINDLVYLDNSGVAYVRITPIHAPARMADRPAPAGKPRPAQPRPTQAKPAPKPAPQQATLQRWAVVIGISSYQDSRVPSLRYAAADAQSFYAWLVSPMGGKYTPSRVKLLLNQEATGRNIKNALYVWLGRAIEEDLVTIYFAGHGSPESPDRPDNLFLLPYDVQYDNIAATGFPMWDIETALKRFIKAKRVVVISDACHSGGVGQAFDVSRRANRGIKVNPINRGLSDLSRIGHGIAVISASAENQFSVEGREYGGGHGVFTYYLLQGLTGAADYNKDGVVTLGELIPYVSEHVRRATRSNQSPTVAGRFDPALRIER